MKTNHTTLKNYHQLLQSEAGEFQLINRLIRDLPQPPFSKLLEEEGLPGIGDDSAIFPSRILGKYQLASVDSFVQGQHFLFEISTPVQIGYKAVATAVSDIAAMGGNARFILINLQLPSDFSEQIITQIYDGITEFSKEHNVFVLGGNVSAAKELSISISVIGDVDQLPILRSGAKEGDDLWVSGTPGLSPIGLYLLRDKIQFSLDLKVIEAAVLRYQRPTPRLILGSKLLKLGVNSAIDLSDGLYQDAGHIAFQSEKSIEIDLSTLAYEGLKEEELIKILSAGGDYELLFTASPNIRQKIEALSLELSPDSKLIRCGKVGPNDVKSPVKIKTSQGILSTTELARQFNLAHLGNDHYGSKNTAA